MKKALSFIMAATLMFGSVTYAADVANVKDIEVSSKIITKSNNSSFDLAIANDEKLIEMLKREGKISKNATAAEAEMVLDAYLRGKIINSTKEDGQLAKEEKKLQQDIKEKIQNYKVIKGNGNKKGVEREKVDPVTYEDWAGNQRKDKILAILIDYSDMPNSSITSEETDMYYSEYPIEHFENMLFGENGYEGPNGENLISMKQYYEAQSGGSYTVEGKVVGWYTAQNNAAYYGGNVPEPDGNDAKPRTLVREALLAAAKDKTIDLSEFDQEDRYDLDGDGNYREPDGLIDHLMIFHAGVGEEAGGGSLGGDAIWSHRANLGGVVTLPGTTAEVEYWGGVLGAYDYTIQPEDGAAGVCAHEYGHDLGLPDEYDTIYSGAGEPVSYWSIMASGSWAGVIPGTEPTGFSPWAKQFFQASMRGNWQTGYQVDINQITSRGIEVLLDEASSKGSNHDILRIDLPKKIVKVNTPYNGEREYFSGSGDELDNSLIAPETVTKAVYEAVYAGEIKLNFKTWYDIEEDWDYASIQVKEEGSNEWTSISGNITTTNDPYEQNPGHGITGSSNGWIDGIFDLNAYAGKKIELRFNYWTDVAVALPGFYVDDIQLTIDGEEILFDNVEGEVLFDLDGFKTSDGTIVGNQYYLVEWRNHSGTDEGLKNIKRGNSLMSFDSGLVVWYVDETYSDNWTGIHPGEGFLGVIDADQRANTWSDKYMGSSRYQMHDAAFRLNNTEKMYVDYGTFYMKDNFTQASPLFDDSKDYSNKDIPDAGRLIPRAGLKIRVIGQSADGSVGKILIYK